MSDAAKFALDLLEFMVGSFIFLSVVFGCIGLHLERDMTGGIEDG